MGIQEKEKQRRLTTVALRVKDRDKQIWFYRDVIGFTLKREENELAILGAFGCDSEMLWLEETPFAEEHFGEPKKLARLGLRLSNIMEFADLYQRLARHQYPIKSALLEKDCGGVIVDDPEGNRLELFYRSAEGESGLKEVMGPKELAQLAKGEYPKLSQGVLFDKIHLNTSKLAEQADFLQRILGFEIKKENGELQLLNRDDFQVGLAQGSGGTLDLPTDNVLGLDFLKFTIEATDFAKMEAQLEEQELEFYLDPKKTIITVYDPTGIEWWFTKAKVR